MWTATSQIQIFTTEMNMDWDDLPLNLHPSIVLLSCPVCVRAWVRVYVHACLSLSCAPINKYQTSMYTL